MTTRSGFSSSTRRSTASTSFSSCAPKCRSDRWTRRAMAHERRSRSVVQEKQQLDVDAEPFGALLLDEIRDLGARHEVNVDVLILVAAALADLANAVGTDEREAFRQHARGSVEFAEALDAIGGEAG